MYKRILKVYYNKLQNCTPNEFSCNIDENNLVYRPVYFTVHPAPPHGSKSGGGGGVVPRTSGLADDGPKFSNLENCCGSENAMPPKFFWDMEDHFEKKKNNKSHYFSFFR